MLRCAVLCVCCSTPRQDLFKRITSLSYLGDVRMGLAEDSRKVERIVAGSYSHFRETYLPLLQVCARPASFNACRQTDRQLLHAVAVHCMHSCAPGSLRVPTRGAHTACS
jgi:hypothetical protein